MQHEEEEEEEEEHGLSYPLPWVNRALGEPAPTTLVPYLLE
jgi:hypothetical protein